MFRIFLVNVPLVAATSSIVALTGCASTYSNLVSGSNLGAQEYQPAVVVVPGRESHYQQALVACRQAVTNRQITAAQEAQHRTVTGAVSNTATGAAAGWQMGAMFKDAGLGTSVNRSVGIGAGAGLLASLGQTFASGSDHTQSATRQALVSCLRTGDPSQKNYRVVE
jgi:hypothetical protein